MILVVLEKTIDDICSVVGEIKKKYPPTAQVYITKKTTQSSLSRYTHPPLITGGWVFLCHSGISSTMVQALERLVGKNVILFSPTNSTELLSVENTLQQANVPYKIVDNHKPDVGKVIKYVQSELPGTTEDVAKYIYKRYGGYMPDIVVTVDALKRFSPITIYTVRRYGVERHEHTLYELADYLVGINSKITYEDAIKVVYDYQFASQYLLKYLIGMIDACITVFDKMSLGSLTVEEVVSGDKGLAAMAPYRIQQIMDGYESVSLEKLYYLKIRLDSIRQERFSLVRLIALLQLNRR